MGRGALGGGVGPGAAEGRDRSPPGDPFAHGNPDLLQVGIVGENLKRRVVDPDEDATVEADYRRFTSQIENQRFPLSNTPIAADGWPTQIFKVQFTLDSSV